MLTGRLVTLREIRRADLPVVHRELDSDVVVRSVSDNRPWRPVALARLEAEFDRSLTEPEPEQHVRFAVQERDDPVGAVVGLVGLYRIDLHNRLASIGISLFPAARGRGLGTDAVRTMCRYAFVVRGLDRVGVETLATNQAMRASAVAAGFTQEGVLRQAAFVLGERVDEVLYGLLRGEWRPDA